MKNDRKPLSLPWFWAWDASRQQWRKSRIYF
jgi:hypothetical protein